MVNATITPKKVSNIGPMVELLNACTGYDDTRASEKRAEDGERERGTDQ
jgi:hypothetical protein